MASTAMPLSGLAAAASHSWLELLLPDPEAEKHAPNHTAREVFSGHFVPVRPKPLPKPRLVIHSAAMAEALGLSADEVASESFLAFFSGEQNRVPALRSWCTPYALSIMGEEYTHQCVFGTGNGYGDGRAMSVGEVVVHGRRWEIQLKGCGRTPFCRRADGRAVLRSSVREFLASEAMHHLGVGTTRALSLIVSGSESVSRPWYGKQTMQEEPCAITARVTPSFLRVGHFDLFARRARTPEATPQQRREHELLVEHALLREFPDVEAVLPLEQRAELMLEQAAERIAAMVAGWLRVGFCQGNFNADNCLISGRTMDYGPFGFMEKYDPKFALWVNSGPHFVFRSQPQAALANYSTLVNSVLLTAPRSTRHGLIKRAAAIMEAAEADAWCKKLGFTARSSEEASRLWKALDSLMRASEVDFTILFRQLARVVELPEALMGKDALVLEQVEAAFYIRPSGHLVPQWVSWLRDWRAALELDGGPAGLAGTPARLRAANPKYVLREWMLVRAYQEARKGDYRLVHELYRLSLRPYDEQPEFEERYFRRAPEEVRNEGGVAFMT